MSIKPSNNQMLHAIAEVKARIRAVYPEATFRLIEGEDPPALYLDAYTDAEDAFAVFDLVSDWLIELSVDAGVHLHVIPLPDKRAKVELRRLRKCAMTIGRGTGGRPAGELGVYQMRRGTRSVSGRS